MANPFKKLDFISYEYFSSFWSKTFQMNEVKNCYYSGSN